MGDLRDLARQCNPALAGSDVQILRRIVRRAGKIGRP